MSFLFQDIVAHDGLLGGVGQSSVYPRARAGLKIVRKQETVQGIRTYSLHYSQSSCGFTGCSQGLDGARPGCPALQPPEWTSKESEIKAIFTECNFTGPLEDELLPCNQNQLYPALGTEYCEYLHNSGVHISRRFSC